MLILNEAVKTLRNKNKIVFANSENGKWIRTTEETGDAIIGLLPTSLETFKNVENYENSEDQKYVLDVLNALIECRIIIDDALQCEKTRKTISIELTNRCNLRCVHCSVEAGEPNSNELTTTEMKELLLKCIAWDPNSISLSGGEPMFRTDFLELLEYLKMNYSGDIWLSTNGTLIDENNVKVLANSFRQIDISIDGIDEDTCAIVRGKGVFSKVIKSIELLHNEDFHNISLSMVFSDKNEYLEDQFIEMNKKLGTYPIKRIFTNMGRGKISKGIFTDMGEKDIYIPEKFRNGSSSNTMGVCNCKAGNKSIFIRHTGEIYPCPSFIKEKYSMGNIFAIDSLESVTNNKLPRHVKHNMEVSNVANSEKCRECDLRFFCWTCPGDTDRITTLQALNQFCKICKPIIEKRVWGEL